jgi:CRISPR-associated endonuclease Csy4
MFSHHLDIKLRPNPDLPSHQILAAVYAKLHNALVRVKASDVAVCFPEYSHSPPDLGETIRLIGTQLNLTEVMSVPWSKAVLDYITVGKISEVPAVVEHRQLTRVQAKSNPERLRRRQMKRHGLTADQARERVPDRAVEKLRLPFLSVASASSGQSFLLFLRLSPPLSNPREGHFNSYGLSVTATIPWF